jgi:hypothetical protein
MKLRTLTATLGILALSSAFSMCPAAIQKADAMPNGTYNTVVKSGGYTLKGICQFTPIPNELGSEAVMLCLNLASASGCNSNIASGVIEQSEMTGVGDDVTIAVPVEFTVNSGKCPYQAGDAEMTLTGNLYWTPDDDVSASPVSATFSDGVTATGSFTRN